MTGRHTAGAKESQELSRRARRVLSEVCQPKKVGHICLSPLLLSVMLAIATEVTIVWSACPSHLWQSETQSNLHCKPQANQFESCSGHHFNTECVVTSVRN